MWDLQLVREDQVFGCPLPTLGDEDKTVRDWLPKADKSLLMSPHTQFFIECQQFGIFNVYKEHAQFYIVNAHKFSNKV